MIYIDKICLVFIAVDMICDGICLMVCCPDQYMHAGWVRTPFGVRTYFASTLLTERITAAMI